MTENIWRPWKASARRLRPTALRWPVACTCWSPWRAATCASATGAALWQVVNWFVDPVRARRGLRGPAGDPGPGRRGDRPLDRLRRGAVPDHPALQHQRDVGGFAARADPAQPALRPHAHPALGGMTEALAFAASFVMFPIMMVVLRRSRRPRPCSGCRSSSASPSSSRSAPPGPRRCSGVWAPNLTVFASQALRILFFASPGPGGAARGLRRGPRLDRLQPAHRPLRVVSPRVHLRRRPGVLAARLSRRPSAPC